MNIVCGRYPRPGQCKNVDNSTGKGVDVKLSRISVLSASVFALSFLSICTAAEQAKPATATRPVAARSGMQPVKQPLDTAANVNGPDQRLWAPLFAANPLLIGLTPMMLAVERGSVQFAGSLLGDRAQPKARDQTQIAELLKARSATATATQTARPGPVGMPPMPNMDPYPTQPAAAPQALPTDANEAAAIRVLLSDPNAILAMLAALPDVNTPVKAVDEKARAEERAWQLRTTDNRSTLARTDEHQFSDEMAVVKKIADGEKASKTPEAIKELLAKRQKRYVAITEELRVQRTASSTTTTQGTGRGRGRGTTGTSTGMNRGRGTTGTTGTTTRGRGTTVAPNEAMPATEPAGGPYSATAGRSGTARRPQDVNQPGLDAETETQVQAWATATYEDKRELLKVVHEQDLKELMALDTVAMQENADKTSISIAALMVLRQQRVDRIGVQMAKEDQRLQNRPTTTTTGGNTRGGRGTTGQQGTMRGGR